MAESKLGSGKGIVLGGGPQQERLLSGDGAREGGQRREDGRDTS